MRKDLQALREQPPNHLGKEPLGKGFVELARGLRVEAGWGQGCGWGEAKEALGWGGLCGVGGDWPLL